MNEDVLVIEGLSAADHTTVHPLGLLAVVILGLSVLFLRRQWSVLPLLAMACFVSSAQRIVIFGLDFDFLRIMVLFGIVRLVLRKEYSPFIWRPLDTMMVLWTVSSVFFVVAREGTVGVLISRLGFAFDALGMYFLFRCLIKQWKDLDRIIFGMIIISVISTAFFVLEKATGRNIFSIFGGVESVTSVRNGRLRCQGPYSHAILAGCFWVSLLPLMAAYWWKSRPSRIWAVIGSGASLLIVFCCASSTPVMGVLAAVLGGFFFYLRYYLRPIRWGVFLSLIGLHLVMKAPVWHLISRIHIVSGSTGYHRFAVIDDAIQHFDDWWFGGCSAYTVASWGIHAGDVTNQYIAEGITSGLFTLCLFLLILALAFRDVGILWHLQKKNSYTLALSWALGVSLFVHSISFIGVAYFGQIKIIWYLLLAVIGSLCGNAINKRFQKVRQPSTIIRRQNGAHG